MMEPVARASGTSALVGPGVMLLSALLFGYFGYGMTWLHRSAITGQVLPYVVILDWTLKVSSVAFVAAALLTWANAVAGNFLYSAVSLAGGALFVVVALWDFMDTQHTAASPVLVLFFGLWNGFGAIAGLRQALSLMKPRDFRAQIGAT